MQVMMNVLNISHPEKKVWYLILAGVILLHRQVLNTILFFGCLYNEKV